jgi:LysR family transcriptional repressor of citA
MSSDRGFDLGQLEAFVRIAAEGSVTRAAVALSRNQSSISMRLGSLERILGASLFTRWNNRMVLTPAGRALLPIAEQMLDLRRTATRDVALEGQASSRKVVSVGSNNWIAAAVLPRVVAAYKNAYPDASLELETHSTRDLVALLQESRIEVAFLNPRLTNHLLQHIASYSEPCVLVSAEKLPVGTSLAGLAEKAFLVCTVGPSLDAFRSLQLKSGHDFFIRARSNAAPLILDLAREGMGIAVLPRSMVQRDLTEGRLFELVLDDMDPVSWTASLVTMRGRGLHPHVQEFTDIVASVLASDDGGQDPAS